MKANKIIAGAGLLAMLAVAFAVSAAPARAEQPEWAQGKGPEKKVEKMMERMEGLEEKLDKGFWGWQLGGESRAVAMKANGEFRVRGVKVNSVNVAGQTVNVSFYGFTRDVSVAGAKLMGGGKTITLADVKAGDMLAAKGSFNADTRVLTVNEVHDLSYQSGVNREQVQNRINELLKLVEQLRAKLGTQ